MVALAVATLHLLILASLAPAGALPCGAPPLLRDDWQSDTPSHAHIDADGLCTVLRGVLAGPDNLHSLLIARHGRLITELYRSGSDRSIYSLSSRKVDFGPADRHDMRSISKSVVGLLVGIVLEEGKLALSTPIADLYPEYPNLREPGRRSITLEHLLTMSSGLEWHESVASYGSAANDETRLFWDSSPIHFVLSRPIAAPVGRQFNYNGGGTAVVADVLVRASKTPLRELARTRLFEPLGITDWEWVSDLNGRPVAFAGLRLKPRDLLKFGRMMLDRGQWQGRQIVPAEWVAQSMRPTSPPAADLGTDIFGGPAA